MHIFSHHHLVKCRFSRFFKLILSVTAKIFHVPQKLLKPKAITKSDLRGMPQNPRPYVFTLMIAITPPTQGRLDDARQFFCVEPARFSRSATRTRRTPNLIGLIRYANARQKRKTLHDLPCSTATCCQKVSYAINFGVFRTDIGITRRFAARRCSRISCRRCPFTH